MTPDIIKEIKAVADDPVAAEKLCAKYGVEYHPIGCDIVTAAETGDDEALCQHVSAVDRKTRQAKFDAMVKRVAANRKTADADAKADAKEARTEAKEAKAATEEAKAKAATEAKAEAKAKAKADAKAEAAESSAPPTPELSIAVPPSASTSKG